MKLKTRTHNLVLSGGRGTAISPSRCSPLATAIALIPVIIAGIFLATTLLLFALLSVERHNLRAHQEHIQKVKVSLEMHRPNPSQESVDLAMAAFGVNGGEHVNWPIFDASLADRGLTSGGTLDLRRTVFVGAPAFTSWGVLGSTLGHEIEIHGSQSFVAILALDTISRLARATSAFVSAERADASVSKDPDEVFWGTLQAERTAYLYEATSAERYGLQPAEVTSILAVMNAYYSENSNKK